MSCERKIKIFVTGVKYTFMFQRLLKMDNKELGHLPLHWRVLVAGSSIFNQCNAASGVKAYRVKEAVAADMSLLNPEIGIALSNTGRGLCGSMLLRKYECAEYARLFKDTHGSLQPGYKQCHEVDIWVPIKKWLSRDDSKAGYWSYNLYLTVMLELGGTGLKYPGDALFGGFAGSCKIYYK